jgi:hypothetical protein
MSTHSRKGHTCQAHLDAAHRLEHGLEEDDEPRAQLVQKPVVAVVRCRAHEHRLRRREQAVVRVKVAARPRFQTECRRGRRVLVQLVEREQLRPREVAGGWAGLRSEAGGASARHV